MSEQLPAGPEPRPESEPGSGVLDPGPGPRPIGAEALVVLLEAGLDRVVLVDSRPFLDFNASHILEAVSVNCSKLMKRRLQQDKVQIQELLQHSAKKKLALQGDPEVVVYDQSSSGSSLSSDSFLSVLLMKLQQSFPSVHLLSGGFSEFSQLFPGLCEGKSVVPSCMSQPCLPLSSTGPTRILPHLYLGCQRDVLDQDLMQQNDIVYVLNASNTCPKPDFIPDSHFLRVPVNDSFCEKILPWLDRSLDFIEKAKASNARVLVHCLAGISRSATIAIAYIMKRMDMPLDEAYRFVKEKRPTISPNFNFLGQLLDFEKRIKTPPGPETRTGPKAHPEPSGEAPHQPQERDPAARPDPVLADVPEQRRLAEALSGLRLAGGPEDPARLKRSFSLDIKAYEDPQRALAPHGGPADSEFFKPSSGFKDAASKPCQFSPVEEVSERSTPERSPDQEEVSAPASSVFRPAPTAPPCRRREENAASFLFGLSRSQQHLARPGPGGTLKGWHSDVLLGSVSASSLAGGWYLSSGVTAFGCGRGPEAVRRRSRQGTGDRGAAGSRRSWHEETRRSWHEETRRSWHEETSFEKQRKRRSCQMELGGGRSREDMGAGAGQASFSGSMELIQVS
ncbi:dual specificity protein phosphatase 16 [Clinocottus analis]|uniref:dual specificity protein phosphatase 16 n=1 Tax=Clinocottus analis TaxID=304258 RepID=UPI0035BF5346